ncbi:MAG: lytic murein transglycosylase [Actinobacteria bacterium]|nr:lytic murein transglycosylase [Actinomycetota bacterium]
MAFVFAIVFAFTGALTASADDTGQSGEGPGMVPNGAEPTGPVSPAVPEPPPAKKPASSKPKTDSGNGDSNRNNSSDGTGDAKQPKSHKRDRAGSNKNDAGDDTQTADDPLAGVSDPTGNGPISVPNLFLKQFQIPPFLLPIYQAAGIQYGIRWEVLAAINEIETNYGRNLNVSSAGALGWMQFMPATWEMYGVDANDDGVKDPYNPVDAIFAAAKYLKAAEGDKDIRRAIFAYNHADWYVDQVILRARLISGVPDGLVDSLTGLTQGHFPVYARATYKGAVRKVSRKAKVGTNAARVVEGEARRTGIKIFSKRNAPVVAVQDAIVQSIGRNKIDGNYITIQDSFGNRYRYNNLGSVSRLYPVPRTSANKSKTAADESGSTAKIGEGKTGPRLGSQERLYANPNRARAKSGGSYAQMAAGGVAMQGYETFDNYFSRPFGLKKEDVVLKPLRKGSHVIGGTILGRVGNYINGRTPYVNFQVRPAGRGAPVVDPKPILDGWKLLESTAIYRAVGVNPLVPVQNSRSIGQILLMSKEQLENYVLNKDTIDIYSCGRDDIRAGQVDRRVLALLAFLDSEGYHPTIASLTCGHGFYTSSGNVSEHSTGTAVDIAAINGESMIANNKPGGLMDETVRKIMTLQGILEPHQIISLFDLGGSTLAMGDHADHIHVGFRPGYELNADGKIGKGAKASRRSILRKNDWYKVFDRLGEIENPAVPTQPSPYAIKVKKKHHTRPGAAD